VHAIPYSNYTRWRIAGNDKLLYIHARGRVTRASGPSKNCLILSLSLSDACDENIGAWAGVVLISIDQSMARPTSTAILFQSSHSRSTAAEETSSLSNPAVRSMIICVLAALSPMTLRKKRAKSCIFLSVSAVMTEEGTPLEAAADDFERALAAEDDSDDDNGDGDDDGGGSMGALLLLLLFFAVAGAEDAAVVLEAAGAEGFVVALETVLAVVLMATDEETLAAAAAAAGGVEDEEEGEDRPSLINLCAGVAAVAEILPPMEGF